VQLATPIAMEEVDELAKTSFAPNNRNDISNSASVNNSGYLAKGRRYDAVSVISAEAIQENDKKTANDDLVLIDGKLSKKSPKNISNADYESVIELKNPLYYINGVAYTEEELYGENPTSPYAPLSKQNSDTIVVLQPERAIPIYGDKGKNGVIIITIKK